MFADVVGFTGFCETHTPEEAVDSLHLLALSFESWPPGTGSRRSRR